MVSFVHIADKNGEQSIVKNGIRSVMRKTGLRGVYAVPVVPNHATTHQWARELKRSGVRTLMCVQFRIPDNEFVLVGKYNGEKLQMTASEAAAAFLAHTDPMGLEAIVPRKIRPGEITYVSRSADNRLAILIRTRKARRRSVTTVSSVIVERYELSA